MHKEIISCIVVLVLVIGGNIITQNNTNKVVDEMSVNLLNLKQEIEKDEVNNEVAKSKMEKVEQVWNKEYETMAYYIEHNELEKVKTELTKLKADIEVEEYTTAVENLETCGFILEHIKDKNSLKIVNLF